MQRKIDPAEVAAKFRVRKLGEADFELYSGSTILPVQRHGIYLDMELVPHKVFWCTDLMGEPGFFTRFRIVKREIGFPADEGWSSSLVDNCAFVIDGEALRHVEFSDVIVQSEELFGLQRARVAASKGKASATTIKEDADSGSIVGHATVAHVAAMPDIDRAECLECAIGLPELHFQKLIDGCLAGRIVSVHFHSLFGGLTASPSYGAARDLILCAGEQCEICIDRLSFEYRV